MLPPCSMKVKYWGAASLAFLVLGIFTVHDLTFDCRWWGDHHTGNAQQCHDGLNLYVAASVMLIVGQAVLLLVSIQLVETTHYEMLKSN